MEILIYNGCLIRTQDQQKICVRKFIIIAQKKKDCILANLLI